MWIEVFWTMCSWWNK